MCSIIVSKKEKLLELVKINQHRGNFSYSLYNQKTKALKKDFGLFPLDLELSSGWYFAHVQTPTNGRIRDATRIHPTEIQSTYLYHNGIITDDGIEYMQEVLGTTESFDTKLLHQMIQKYGFECLSDIEGSFACVYRTPNEDYMFRTKQSKLYVSDDFISSEKHEDSLCINFDTVYTIKLEDRIQYEEINKFKTLYSNYTVKGELSNKKGTK